MVNTRKKTIESSEVSNLIDLLLREDFRPEHQQFIDGRIAEFNRKYKGIAELVSEEQGKNPYFVFTYSTGVHRVTTDFLEYITKVRKRLNINAVSHTFVDGEDDESFEDGKIFLEVKRSFWQWLQETDTIKFEFCFKKYLEKGVVVEFDRSYITSAAKILLSYLNDNIRNQP